MPLHIYFFVIVLEGLLGPGNMWSYRLGKDRVKMREGYRPPSSKDMSALLGYAAATRLQTFLCSAHSNVNNQNIAVFCTHCP